MKSNEERVKSILKKRDDYIMKKKKEGYALITCLCAIAAVIVGTSVVSPNIDLNKNEKQIAFNSIEEKELKTFASKDELIKAIKESENYKNYNTRYYMTGMKGIEVDYALNDMMPNAVNEAAAESKTARTGAESEHSETNTQVQGVDEADIVKTNGDFIYYLNNNRLLVFDNTKDKLSLKKEISFNEKNDDKNYYSYSNANEMYLTDKYVIVIVSGYFNNYTIMKEAKRMITGYDYSYNRNSTKMMIYDINSYELVREIETEGSYLSSRKVDDDVYMITNKYIYYYRFNDDEVLPLCKDSVVDGGETKEVAIDTVRCFPSFEEDKEMSYMIITSFSLDKIDEKANVETFIGTGNEIYCSKDNLYVTKPEYNYSVRNTLMKTKNSLVEEDTTKTVIRKFAIYDGKVKYVAEGKVPGTLLNQFSMDEYDNHFRITTTKGDTWNGSSENNLYVLDENLKIVGTLTGLGKGERIYSTRFMEDKCYVVTYKTVDPLYVLDLSNPEKPSVLGELKIPGYSSYLHPLGDHYLIGFGEDSVEKTYKNYDGTEGVTAYSTGLKLAIFDVSDYNNPKQIDSVKIGGRGSSSELLYNHKSLLFRPSDGLFAFPVSLYTEDAGYYEDGTPRYGKQEFSGFVVFEVSPENGIDLRGKISNDANDKYYYNQANRIIYIGDKLYSIFNNMIKVNDIKTIKELDKIEIETNEKDWYIVY